MIRLNLILRLFGGAFELIFLSYRRCALFLSMSVSSSCWNEVGGASFLDARIPSKPIFTSGSERWAL